MPTLQRPQGGPIVPREARVVTDDDPKAEHDPGLLPEEHDESAELALSTALTELGEEDQKVAMCMVWRIPFNTKDADEYLFRCNVLEFTRRDGIDDIARRYGPGDYRIRVYKINKIYTQKRIKIGAPLVTVANPASDVLALRGEMNVLGITIKDGFAAALERIVSNQRPQPTLSDQIKDLAALRELSGGAGPAPKDAKAQIKETLELMALMKATFGGEAGGDSGFTGALGRVAEKYLPQIIDGVNKGNATDGALKAVAPERSITEGEATDMGALRDMQLKMALDFLVNSAARGLPAETYADVAVDQVPPADLAALLDRPDWLTALSRIDERAQQHAAWFSKLREEILSVLRENGIPLTTPAPASTLEGGSKPLSS